MGFFGIALTLALFALLAGRCLLLGLEAVRREKYFLGYCAFGIGIWLAVQSLISIGVNFGVLPTKGLTLPLISSGGSSAMMTMAAMGLVFRLSAELRRIPPDAQASPQVQT
jgi:cell division protein FtsW